jgi:hypothetical protein
LKRPVCTGGLPETRCADCAAPLKRDEIAISRRLIGRGITRYFCIPCLARRLRVDEAVIEAKIREYRAMGCALFCVPEENEKER